MANEEQYRIKTGDQIGDYVIGKAIARGTHTTIWEATQLSVQRSVMLCSADPSLASDPELKQGFIDDVRKKATVDHPLIGSVLEAVDEDHYCFYALEKLNGQTLGDMYDQGKSMTPLQMVRILRNIASAYMYLEDNGTAWLSLTPHDVFIDDKYHCRITNMAVSGEHDQNISTTDKRLLGQLLQDILEPGQPGSTRTSSLLDYMADFNREEPLSWTQIHSLADEVERQLAEPQSQQIQSATMQMEPTNRSALIAKTLTAAAVIIVLLGTGYYFFTRQPTPEVRDLPGMIHIPAGSYPGPDGLPVELRGYWIDSHEVTISDYAKFLEALDALHEENKTVFQHDDQPENKTSHEPDDWNTLYSAAKAGGTWNQQKIDLNCPVVGVDWWDAYAYAEWKAHRLPTREEWYAACSASDNPEKLKPSGWSPVDQADQTQNGIFGLAGNVSEWTRKRSLNPADPTQPARYVICGASYLKVKYGARAREWVDDRSLRRPDLGFRTVSTTPQEN